MEINFNIKIIELNVIYNFRVDEDKVYSKIITQYIILWLINFSFIFLESRSLF
jgi:hypothetical protein